MEMYSYLSLVLLLPLAVFVINGLFGKYINTWSGLLGTLGMGLAAIISYASAYEYFYVSGKVNGVYQTLFVNQFTWLQLTNTLHIDLGFMVDSISMMMLVVITTVSLMVHIFSLGYMHGEKRYATYYAFLSLFSFSMLGLVLSLNIFQMYMFWELVGVSSFLLIGYYFDKPSAVAAAKKAFIVTRFADLGFLAGILTISYYSQSLNFTDIIAQMSNVHSPAFATAAGAEFLGLSAITWALVLIFIGGAGKSAMFPLHIWLPDAMEGPTPVSALIHAATMVVAGVFLVARLFPVFHIIPIIRVLIIYTGLFSSLFAAIIACTQTDIKRVLAYSTMSQIGYMMFALGVSGYGGHHGAGFSASMFHLFTHAMFKALLFLCAGAIIHYVHSNEMKDMGGLRKYMPITHFAFLIACLSIAGIPPFAGYFSKEEILTAALHRSRLVYAVGLFTAFLTSFYMFRLYFSIFWSKSYESSHASDEHHSHHSGEAPFSMKLPLLLLVVFSLISGFVPFSQLVSSNGEPFETTVHVSLAIIAVSASVLGIALAYVFYQSKNDKSDRVVASIKGIYTTIYHKFYVDEVYLFITKKIIFQLIARPAAWFDRNVVDAGMRYTGLFVDDFSKTIRPVQSGKISEYLMWFLMGTLVLTVFILYLI